ncbi:hypothetical protein ACFOY8_12545 [Thalassospira xianhensis]|uniref:Uncharacterized protein n=2 Tax=Thalassospira TaxID=168934 RepID=A0A285TTR3_9PROT|nr:MULTISPECIES: hypothetical protein [Thalassospira]RCK06307.1 hypothetical protein TH5_08885 [Thalassospira xianhensis MCCC 1A02616]SOC27483.1 hypothetical protein SAMN05428964_105434 [Thalassospira xiamenensis]
MHLKIRPVLDKDQFNLVWNNYLVGFDKNYSDQGALYIEGQENIRFLANWTISPDEPISTFVFKDKIPRSKSSLWIFNFRPTDLSLFHAGKFEERMKDATKSIDQFISVAMKKDFL